MLQAMRKFFGSSPAVVEKPLSEIPDWNWTPDQALLEQFFEQLVFIPDDKKVGGKHHAVVRDITPGGVPKNKSVYTHNKFLAYKRDMGDYSTALIMPPEYVPSGFITKGTAPDPGRIQGELYSVYANKLYLLDKHMENGVKFARQRVRITYPWRYVSYGKKHPLPKISPHCFTTITAWMYVGIPRYWDPMIGGVFAKAMDLYKHRDERPWIDEFYRLDFNNR